ncbi:MAG: SNF2 helicase associated domain-containing protein [Fibrobacteres bacterium]|nr:SNF2 helicase associated domain-containing protein [Fibrobacterota bacterium]
MDISNIDLRIGIKTAIRGKDYFSRGLVHQVGTDGNVVSFKVHGSSVYDTNILLDDSHSKIIHANCSCPIGELCKHIFACALYLEKRDDKSAATQKIKHVDESDLVVKQLREANLFRQIQNQFRQYRIPQEMIEKFIVDPRNTVDKLLSTIYEKDGRRYLKSFLSAFDSMISYRFQILSAWMKKSVKEWEEVNITPEILEKERKETLLENGVYKYKSFISDISFRKNTHDDSGIELSELNIAILVKDGHISYRENDLFNKSFSISLFLKTAEKKYVKIEDPSSLFESLLKSGIVRCARNNYRVPIEGLAYNTLLIRILTLFSTNGVSKYSYSGGNNVFLGTSNELYELCSIGVVCFLDEKMHIMAVSDQHAKIKIKLSFKNNSCELSSGLCINGRDISLDRKVRDRSVQTLPGLPPVLIVDRVMYRFSHPLTTSLFNSLVSAVRDVRSPHDLQNFHETVVIKANEIFEIEFDSSYTKTLGKAEAFKLKASFEVDKSNKPVVKLAFDYDGKIHPPILNNIVNETFDIDRETKTAYRDYYKEHRAIEKITEAFGLNIDGDFVLKENKELAAAEIAAIASSALPNVDQVHISDDFLAAINSVRPSVSINVEPSGIDYLEVSFSLGEGIESSELPLIMNALQSGQKAYKLKSGLVLLLNQEDFKEIFAILDALEGRKGFSEGKPVRLSRADMLYIASRLDDESNVLPQALRNEIEQRLESFNSYEPPPTPPLLTGALRGYQQTGFHWLDKMTAHGFNAILADDMGLGKTVQTITLLLKHYANSKPKDILPSLIVCPATLVYNWMAEFSKFAPSLKTAALYGNKSDRDELLKKGGYQVFVTSYNVMQRDIDEFSSRKFLFTILDEAHKIKNRSTQTFKSCRLIKADHKLALTGTPVENRTEDLFSIFEFLEPGFLSLFKKSDDDEKKRQLGIRKRVTPFILRRMKSQVLDDLPGKSEQVLMCELSDAQKKLYLALREQAASEAAVLINDKGIARSKIHILALLTRLKQLCCHPALLDDKKGSKVASAKLDLLVELLEEVKEGGHRALVFSQFTSMLAIIKQHLDENNISYLYMDGTTKDRLQLTQKFNADPTITCFLISLKTGGHGLNLTGADTVIHYDQWWNPAVEAQATDRAHRIGQTKAVTVYKLICKQTIEEKIMELQNKKRELFTALIDDDATTLALSAEDITELLRA